MSEIFWFWEGENHPGPYAYTVSINAMASFYVSELGQLSADQLMAHIKSLQNTAYQLGIIEAKELARGKFLKVLEQKPQ